MTLSESSEAAEAARAFRGVDLRRGLASDEAERRLAAFGPNVLPSRPPRSTLRIVLAAATEPLFFLLIAAAVLYLALGGLAEGLFLAFGAAVSIGLVAAQEARSEATLAALASLAEPRARILRDGVVRVAPARVLVPGDVVLVGEGERLPADAVLVGGEALTVDESALTGESASVVKQVSGDPARDAAADPDPGGDGRPHLFAGAMTTRGQGVALVARTGARTRLGRIGASLAGLEGEPTLLQRQSGRIIAVLGGASLGFCAVVATLAGVLGGDWIEGLLVGLTLAIALLPEEFPMVLAVFFALGAMRLARRNVLVRRAAVIETLGAASVLCVDKTGTLTENRMRIAAVWTEAEGETAETALDAAGLRAVLRTARAASAARPVDPIDHALDAAAGPAPGETPASAYPLTSARLAVIQGWPAPDGRIALAAKGAPEAVFDLCGLAPPRRAAIEGAVAGLADRGLRVIGVAARLARRREDAPEAAAFRFLGLIAFADPLRPDVPAAIAEAARAGVRTVMITGDYPATARAIAVAAGLAAPGAPVVTGREIAAMDAAALRDCVRTVRIFARVTPEQKLALVRALSANGEVAAMTGDGVNDAPALEAAHIGVAMGGRGSDVAREAADIVLLDDRFASIVAGVRLGRRIFANLRKALVYILAIHVPIAGLALGPLLLGLPPLLYPMHVVLLELVIDPICALVFEAEPAGAGAMQAPPRKPDEPLFGAAEIALGLAQGAGILVAVLGGYALALEQGLPETEARALGFVMLVVGNLALAFADSAEPGARLFARHRRPFLAIVAAALAVLAAILAIPALGAVFAAAPPPPAALALGVAAALVAGSWFALVRRFTARRAETTDIVGAQLG